MGVRIRAFLSQLRPPSPWRKHVATINRIFPRLGEGLLCLSESKALDLQNAPLRLDKPEAFDFFSFSFTSEKLSLRLGKLLRLGKAVPSPWRRSASGAGSAFLLFFPSSLLALLSISTKLTYMRGQCNIYA